MLKENADMRRPIAIAFVVLIMFILNVGVAKAQSKTYSGEIMDSSCAKDGSHAMYRELRQKNGGEIRTLLGAQNGLSTG
jgi:hypothetical protein